MKNRITSLIVSLTIFVVNLFSIPIVSKAVETNEGGIYQIATAQDLVDFSNLVNSGNNKVNAEVVADIDMSGINFSPIGTFSDYEGVPGYGGKTVYRGTFDGNGFIISNLTITVNDRIETGMFSRVTGGTIKNVNLKNAKVTNTTDVRAGILAGELEGAQAINCNVTGTLSASPNKQKGGIAGEGYDVKLTDCFSSYEPIINTKGDYCSVENSFSSNKLYLFEGGGTKKNPYIISNKNDLIKMSSAINNAEYGKAYSKDYYLQTSDIDLENNQFTPIGKHMKDGVQGKIPNFEGYYNGNGYKIEGLYVNESSKFAGLFGSSHGTIENLEVHGNINSKGISTGGIVGEIGCNGIVSNCCFFGDVTSEEFATGGIVGYMYQSGKVENCYHNGNIKSGGSAGGIVGRICSNIETTADANSVSVCNSYNIGSVNGMAGAIIGYVEFYDNAINSVTIKKCYSLKDDGNDIVNGNCPSYETKALTANELRNAADIISNQLISNPIPSFNNGYPIFEWQLENAEKSKPINIPFVGVGTKEEPYQISTIEDLISLSEVTNDKTTMDYFSGCHYIQTADIDLNNKLFTPIAINCAFEGTYNGNYHKITNLKISTSKSSTGLFSKVTNGGCITKLSVEGKVNSSGNNIGGIAGSLLNSASITDCDYHGSVDGSENVGALIGTVKNGVTVESCYSDANINGQSAVGGLIGCIQTGLDSNVIKRLYFSGTVKCDDTKQGAVLGINNDKNIAMDNIYFLSDVCGGNAVNSESAVGCTKLSITALKACSDMLGSPFTSNGSTIYGGYPIFEWQSTAYKFKGSGTEGNPYRISTKADLDNMRDLINSNYYSKIYRDAHFIQTADIDLEDELWIPIASSNSGQTFRGTYDGACHYIRGLNINSTSESSGLFGITDNAKIHDIVVYGSIIGTVKNTGGIIGTARNNTTVERCGFIGSVTSEIEAGGIIGSIKNGCTVIDCYHNGKVSSKGVSGGIIGSISFDDDTKSANVIIQNCYQANGIVNGENYSGCIVGSCTIKKGTSNTVSILNCFATADADADTKQAGATKDNTLLVTKSMLKGASEDLGASFMNNTIATLNDGYPVFKWQIKSDLEGDVNNDGVFNIADVVMLQKWLLCAGPLTTWENGDLCKDNRIDVFDLCMMKRKLINS